MLPEEKEVQPAVSESPKASMRTGDAAAAAWSAAGSMSKAAAVRKVRLQGVFREEPPKQTKAPRRRVGLIREEAISFMASAICVRPRVPSCGHDHRL